ncbi:MAG: PepSY domain-containing protein [Bacteroidetes Order II. Incertae sedis bacterium]|nr:PepSY domain-containing protein [Bacteroidetes Order II. bacterium]
MQGIEKRKKQAQTLRTFRTIHRITGIFLFVFFMVIAVSGLLLGWKKNSNGWLLAPTQKGTTTELREWKPLHELQAVANRTLHEKVSPELSTQLDRIDVRQDKGSVKFVFADHYWGIQLDGATGKVLLIERRNADLVEHIHDASILDRYLETQGGIIKLLYTSIMGLALLVFSITGFWLWYGPRQMQRKRTLQKHKT